jgi:hypothetical protein
MSLSWMPCLVRSADGAGIVSVAVGHDLVDAYLRFVAARARPNTVLAVGFDLKVFFSVVAKEPADVTTADVLGFIEAQRRPRRGNVVRIEDREVGLSARTIKRRLSSVAGLFNYLIATGASERNVDVVVEEHGPHLGRSQVPGTAPRQQSSSASTWASVRALAGVGREVWCPPTGRSWCPLTHCLARRPTRGLGADEGTPGRPRRRRSRLGLVLGRRALGKHLQERDADLGGDYFEKRDTDRARQRAVAQHALRLPAPPALRTGSEPGRCSYQVRAIRPVRTKTKHRRRSTNRAKDTTVTP